MNAIAQRLSARQWTQAMGLSLVVVFTLLVAFALYPQFLALREADANYTVLADAVDRSDALSEEIALLTASVGELSSALHGSASAMPRNQLEAFVVGQMQRVSWRNNLELRSIRPGLGERISVFDEVLFEVQVSGSYFDIYAWLLDLNEELGFVVVRQFNLSPSGVMSTDPALTARFTLVAYREASDAA